MQLIARIANPLLLPLSLSVAFPDGPGRMPSPAHGPGQSAESGASGIGRAKVPPTPRQGSGNFNGICNVGNFNGNGNTGSFNGNGNRSSGNGNGSARDGTGNGNRFPDE